MSFVLPDNNNNNNCTSENENFVLLILKKRFNTALYFCGIQVSFFPAIKNGLHYLKRINHIACKFHTSCHVSCTSVEYEFRTASDHVLVLLLYNTIVLLFRKSDTAHESMVLP